MTEIISKEQFLLEHNRLSPVNLQATFALLTKFQQEKKPLLKDSEWSFKLRIPFISWLVALELADPEKKDKIKKQLTKHEYQNYPETHFKNA